MMSTSDATHGSDKMTVRSVERALDILSAFIGHEKHLSLTDIATKVQLHKSTVHRLLNSLEDRGFVEKIPDLERYRLGNKIIELSSYASRSSDLIQTSIAEMRKLRDDLGETVSLYIRDRYERIRLHAVESNQVVRRIAIIGQRLPLHAGAASKILIAYLSAPEREKLFSDPDCPPELKTTVYQQTLAEIQQRGYATSFGERETGVAAISAPIFYENGSLAAALSLSGPLDRFPQTILEQHAKKVMSSANHISNLLVYNQINHYDTNIR